MVINAKNYLSDDIELYLNRYHLQIIKVCSIPIKIYYDKISEIYIDIRPGSCQLMLRGGDDNEIPRRLFFENLGELKEATQEILLRMPE